MRALVVIVAVLLLTAPSAAHGLIGTWLTRDGDVVAFGDDGTGVNLTADGEKVEFTFDVPVAGKMTLSSTDVATDYRYVTDGTSLLLKAEETGDWLVASRVDLKPEQAVGRDDLLRHLPEPFDASGVAGDALRELDAFAQREEDQDGVSVADVEGTWAGKVISFEESGFGILTIRGDGEAKMAFGSAMRLETVDLTVARASKNTLSVELRPEQPTIPSPSLRLVVTGESALLMPAESRRSRWSGHLRDAILLSRTDLAPSEAAQRLMATETLRLQKMTTTQPVRR
ncbi:MAG: hypothetical protein AAF561_14910 [Planctomycetota bacterium]